MKKLSLILTGVLFASFILTSCGEKSEAAEVPSNESAAGTSESAGGASTTTDTPDEVPATEVPEGAETSSDFDCDQFITEYESFVTDYIAIIKKQKANPSDMSVMTDYTKMMNDASSMSSKASKCTDPKYVSKLAALAQKINKAASGM
jgi:hypothetical protein